MKKWTDDNDGKENLGKKVSWEKKGLSSLLQKRS